jgi:hypothetical protein
VGFLAAAEARDIDAAARLLPIRQAQLQKRRGERGRELDVPTRVEWPDGRRGALLFAFEEKTEPGRFSIYRLARYCLELAELFDAERVVPVVIFLHPGRLPVRLTLGGDRHRYLDFRHLACALFRLQASDYFKSRNIAARLNLPDMACEPSRKVDVYAYAVRGVLELEPSLERRLKYLDLVDTYANPADNERIILEAAVGRSLGCAPRGGWQGTTRGNKPLLQAAEPAS